MKILLADDEPIARTMLEHWLVGWGYEVTLARDGEAALQALKDDPELRLLVVDWVMPKKDGIEVCKAIRNGPQEPYVYVVLLTAKDDKSDIIAGLDAGADDYLVKPCNPLELKVRLRAGRRVIELQEQLVKARESLRFEAMHDSLTGLLNRGAVLEQLTKELVRAARHGAPVSVLMGDLDHFKSINDTHGHVAGDAVLRETARRLKVGVRAYDSVGRLGGEEFIAVLPECDSKTGLSVAQRLCRSLADQPTSHGGKHIAQSISIGVAATDQYGSARAEELIRAADAALYRAKHAGRSRALLAIDKEFEAVKEVSQTIPASLPAE
ncbi:MAG: response regulator receiver modulated diguanylate cyclase [Polyangiaceae bacterium]|jgi:diguanylate cyclase (GGDEF)-like protein|nr:response regulator receiver modulated diguanylate cyclase [Polyangiaceae bacterium]